MSETRREELAAKIRALLDKALIPLTPGSTEEQIAAAQREAEAAVAMAQRLMAKHKLSLEDVEAMAHGAPSQQELGGEFVRRPIELGAVFGQPTTWLRILLGDVAGVMFCRAFWHDDYARVGHKSTGFLVGRETDVLIAEYLFTYLREEIRRRVNAQWPLVQTQMRARGVHKLRWLDGALQGAGAVVRSKLADEFATQMQTVKGTGKELLIVQEADLLADAVQRLTHKVRTTELGGGTDYLARRHGAEAAVGIEIRRGIAAGPSATASGPRQIRGKE